MEFTERRPVTVQGYQGHYKHQAVLFQQATSRKKSQQRLYFRLGNLLRVVQCVTVTLNLDFVRVKRRGLRRRHAHIAVAKTLRDELSTHVFCCPYMENTSFKIDVSWMQVVGS